MRTEHIQYRIDQQGSIRDSLKAAYANLIKVGRNNLTTIRIQTRLEALQDKWQQFYINHQAINLALAVADAQTRRAVKQRSYFVKDYYADTYENYLETTEMMRELLNEKKATSTSSSTEPCRESCSRDLAQRAELSSSINGGPSTLLQASQSAPGHLSPAQVLPLNTSSNYQFQRLPRIDLPKFNGTLSEWLSFKGLFISMVYNNPFLPPVEKLTYLKTNLVGSASLLLKNTDTTNENFEKAWETVLAFYENERRLVNAALRKLFSLKKMTTDSAAELEHLYMCFGEVYRTLESLGRPIHYCDDFLVFMAVQRLDSDSVKAWELHLGATRTTPTWNCLKDFIESRLLSLQSFESSQSSNQKQHPRPSSARAHFAETSPSCAICSAKHYTHQCEQLTSKPTQQCRDLVKAKGLCFNCLGNHKVTNCRSTRRCKKCGQKHHTMLHLNESKSTISQSTEQHKQVNHARREDHRPTSVLLATAKLNITNSKGQTKSIWALLDQGSEISLVSEKLVQHLDLHRSKSSISIVSIGSNQVGKTRGVVTLPINPHFNSSIRVEITAYILPKLTSHLPTSQCPANSQWDHLDNLQLADPQFLTQKRIDLIIGADYYGSLLEGSVIKGPANSPVAQLTKVGWIISGPIHQHTRGSSASVHHCSVHQDLNNLLEKFWLLEEPPTTNKSSMPAEDERCEQNFIATQQRDSTGRYIVRLPFKTSQRQLGNSFVPALKALNHLNVKFVKNPEFSVAYSSFIQEYNNLKHMVQVPEKEEEPQSVFYLPHHGVIKESSTTTKLRVVFNGSCPAPGGQSLNEILHTGAKLQVDLLDVLIWFRQFRYIFSADIEKMYRQIDVHPDDRKYQRILWRENGDLVKYELTTVTYGLACAPFLALRTLAQLTIDEGSNYPEAIDIMNHGRYVDDIFGGSDSIEGIQEKTLQVNNLCKAGGFPLRKWISNHPDALHHIPPEHCLPSTSVQLEDNIIRALGLFWNPSTDDLHFKFSSVSPTKITKRAVLSKIAQLFDPMGLLSPVFIQLKIFMQELWAVKMQWDDELPPDQLATWNRRQALLHGLDTIQIPRWIKIKPAGNIELHCFCDASQFAMAAAIFVRTSTVITTDFHLLCSKTKVAPLKRMTIPRLELSAAVIAVKLTKHCQHVLHLENSPVHFWTDSTIVHTWINNHPSRWKDFVHNRVCYIKETMPTAQWHHIAGKINPADCATRGLSAEELKVHSLWWSGPQWLRISPDNWPNYNGTPITSASDLEEKSVHHVMTVPSWDLITRYSSWKKLTRITAMCQRMVKLLMKQPAQPLNSPITPSEITSATNFLVKYIQQRHFLKEIEALKNQKEIQKDSPLLRLNPFLCPFGLLRVGGRLKNSNLSFSNKHPCILPRNSHISTLVIQDAHFKSLHGSTQETLAILRQQFWVIGGRAPVRSWILKCITCARHRKQHAQYLMGQLPVSRVTPSRPFLHSGVDYAGPFSLKTWKGKARLYKAWIAVFVCFSTSAVHLEVVSDYSTEAFLSAYKRFVSRRGICASLTSDCGTNFKGADTELKRLFSQHSEMLGKFASHIASDGTTWKFNPPSAPHFGGKFGAAVKSMKYHLRRMVGEIKLTYEQLATILAQIESILNSRPLCALTDDPDDLEALTPGHFLIGEPLCLVPEPNLEVIKTSRLSHWQHITQLMQSFWTRWSKEYLQRHQSIYKWNRNAKPIKTGDLVLIIDERLPPGKWPLGRVIDVHPGSDNIVRVATVKTSTSTYMRPVVKLSPLYISSNVDNSSPDSTKAGGNVRN